MASTALMKNISSARLAKVESGFPADHNPAAVRHHISATIDRTALRRFASLGGAIAASDAPAQITTARTSSSSSLVTITGRPQSVKIESHIIQGDRHGYHGDNATQ